jgi:hypothetical protein
LGNLPERGLLEFDLLVPVMDRATDRPEHGPQVTGHPVRVPQDIVPQDIVLLTTVTTQAMVQGIGDVIPIIAGVGITTITTGGSMQLRAPLPVGSFAALVNLNT